jgi:transcriptional regulator with XRE-family HTH domain
MVNKQKFSKRLNELLQYYEISASKLALQIGVQRSSISHLLSGRNNPSLEFILKILDNYSEVTFDWLVRGKGKLEIPEFDSVAPTLFDQNMNSPIEKTPEPIISEKTDVEPIAENLIESSKNKKVSKIVLFYKDGSFEHYTND